VDPVRNYEDSNNGADPLFGLGTEYTDKHFGIRGEFVRYNFGYSDGFKDHVNTISLSLIYMFSPKKIPVKNPKGAGQHPSRLCSRIDHATGTIVPCE
jgi:hypothetical protein